MPASLTPQKFVAKWSQIRLSEIASAQSHFNDVCALVTHWHDFVSAHTLAVAAAAPRAGVLGTACGAVDVEAGTNVPIMSCL
jgi:hypothetical protein